MLQLGSPGEDQLDLLQGRVMGISSDFQYHPFRFIDWKEDARVKKKAAGKTVERTTEVGRRFYIDFGFMRHRRRITPPRINPSTGWSVLGMVIHHI